MEIDLVTQLAQLFAIRIQCAFLGWPDSLHEPLLSWIRKNHEATLARDTRAMATIALEFDGYISELLEARRQAGAAAPDDVTTGLLRERIGDRALNHEEIVSLLRNWTVGELGTITAKVPPIVILTSNRTRELHEALKRRCYFHWIDHPEPARELEIIKTRLPGVDEKLAQQVVDVVQSLRNQGRLRRSPGVAEALDWAQALNRLGGSDIDADSASLTIGALCKDQDDQELILNALRTVFPT